MATATTYNYSAETGLYWNLLKELKDSIKNELIALLQGSIKSGKDTYAAQKEQKCYYDILSKFLTYSKYGENWDGESAAPLTEKVKANFIGVLNSIDKKYLSDLTIYPETNGTLLIDSTKNEAGISLGDNTFSYYITENNEVSGENNIPFSEAALTDTIKKINGYK